MIGIIRRCYHILDNKVKATNWYKNQVICPDNYPTNEWYREHSERNFDLVVLGSSSARYAYNFENSNIKAFNWALQPQSMEFNFNVLKTYFSILKKGGRVLINFSPMSALSVENKWAISSCDRYYSILDASLIPNYAEVERRRRHPIISTRGRCLKYLYKDIDFETGNFKHRKCISEKDFEEDAIYWTNLWKKEFAISDLNAPLTDFNKLGMKTRVALVNQMIEFCLERELEPIAVFTPIHSSMYKFFSDTYWQNYFEAFKNQLKFPVSFLDFYHDRSFISDDFFYNSFFMNDKGASLFTFEVLSRLGREKGPSIL